jgi:putative MATE family efflux protein
MKKTACLTEGPVWRTILGMTGPMTVGMVGMVAFNLIDTFFIGKLGTEPLAAMGYSLSVVMFQGAISMGLGVGASALISRAIGRGDHPLVQRLTVDALVLSVVLVLLLVSIGIVTIDPVFSFLGARGNTLVLVRQYMFIWYIGVPFVVIPMVGNNAIRATGNTVIPSTIMVVAIIVNTILDPLLIFGIGPFPRLELRGAAIATVCARAVTMVTSLLFLRYRFDMLTSRLPSGKALIESWKRILHIAGPAGFTQLLIPVSLFAVTMFIARYGEHAVAGFGIGSRVEMFVLSPLMALGAVMIPYVGQNAGADRIDRILKGIRFGFAGSLVWGGFVFLVMISLGRQIASRFSQTPEVISVAHNYLVIVSLSYGFQGTVVLAASLFNGQRKPFRAMGIISLRAMVLYVPLAWIGSRVFGLSGIFFAAAAASILGGLAGVWWVFQALTVPLRQKNTP